MKILIVEDDPISGLAATSFFEEDGHSVIYANTTDQALESLTSSIPDVLLCDWSIEGSIRPPDLVQKIRSLNSQLCVAFVTGYEEGRLAEDLKMLRPYLFFLKPVDYEQIVNATTQGDCSRSAN